MSSPKETAIENVYFWISLGFLLSRTHFVIMIAARLNEESKRPVNVLRAIPQHYYHIEVTLLLYTLTQNRRLKLYYSLYFCFKTGKTLFGTGCQHRDRIHWTGILSDQSSFVIGSIYRFGKLFGFNWFSNN